MTMRSITLDSERVLGSKLSARRFVAGPSGTGPLSQRIPNGALRTFVVVERRVRSQVLPRGMART